MDGPPRNIDVIMQCTGACGLLRELRRWLLAALLSSLAAGPVWAATGDAAPSGAGPVYRFRLAADEPAATLGPGVISPQEREYLRQLPELRVALARPAFRPYEVIGADGEISGVHAEMLVHLARTFGMRMRPVVFDSFPASLEAAQRGEVDVLLSVGVTSERARYLEFTLGATPMISALFTRQGMAPPGERARYAVTRNNIAADFVRRRWPAATLVELPTADDALRAVAAGEADCYVANLLPTLDRIHALQLAGIEVHRIVQYGSGYFHFAVRKELAPLARILNKGLSAVRGQAPRELSAALAGLPASVMLPAPRTPDPQHLAVIVERPVWRVGAVRGLALLNDVDADGRHSGIAAEYVDAVAQQLGVGVQLEVFDSVAQMLDALRAGAVDVVPFLTRTAQREREFGYSAPYVEMPYVIVARSDAPLYWDLGSLRGRRIALAPQHPLREELAARHPDIQVVEVPSGLGAMDAVLRGDADAAVEVKFYANLRIHADNDGRLRIVAQVPELPSQFHFATSGPAKPLLPLIDDALAAIAPAEKERMLRRWIAQDLVPAFAWRRHLPLVATGAGALLMLLGASAWWMRRLREEAAARGRSEALLDDVARTVPGMTFRYVLGDDGQLVQTWLSPAAQEFLGAEITPGCTIAQCLAPYVDDATRDAVLALERRCAHTGERFKVTAFVRTPGAPARWLHAESVRHLDREGRAVWTGYMVDVSSERELQQRLAREAEARHLLLASASHELRAPTHNLWLALQSIETGHLPASAASAVRIARQAAQTLAQLLDDVLDAARFDRRTLRFRPVRFNPRQLLARLEETWSATARAKGLALRVQAAPDLPEAIRHDPLRVEQVLTNLLSNACKYTPSGQVALEGHCVGRTLVFAVTDTGPGLDAEAAARLFRPFVTLNDNEPAPPEGRTGLGLVTSRRIAEGMGGRLEISSQPGQGSCFTFSLPLLDDEGTAGKPLPRREDASAGSEAAAPGDAGPLAAAAAGARAGATVVVCDDDPVSRLLAAQMLRLRGYRVIEAGDAVAALAACRDTPVDAVVTDLEMPGMSGRELIDRLHAAPLTGAGAAGPLVVVCSGHPMPEAGAKAMAGVGAFLQKPMDIDELVRTLRSHGVMAESAALAPAP